MSDRARLLVASNCSRESSDTGESSSSPPLNGEIALKSSICLWKKEDLLALKICVSSHCDMSKNPMDIVNTIDLHHIGRTSFFVEENKFQDLISVLERRVKFVANEIRNTAVHQVMTKCIDDMNVNDVLFQLHNVWSMRPSHLPQNEEKLFKSSFQVYGRAFSRYLRDCIYLRDKQGMDLSENAYQHLFVNFLQVFGVKCQFAPLIPTTHMRIQGQKVSGVPNIIGKFNINNDGEIEQKSLFVCEVIKHCQREEEPAAKKMRCSSSNSGPAMPDSLLGQHGGKLLLYYPSSIAKNASIGLIVEKTHVTFTALLLTDKDFTKLKDGSLKFKNNVGPKLIFTKPYNFMVKEDRDHLIEPLLKLGFIQDINSVY